MTCLGRVAVALSLLVGLWPGLAAAQTTKAGVVTALEGIVTAARAAAPQPVALKFKDDVFVNDRVVAGDRSLARLLLGGKAVVTIRERSAFTIFEIPGRSTVNLDSGKVALAVAKDRMRPGERIEVKTPNAVATVRGTVFVVEVIRASASADNAQGGVTVNHYVFTGEIALTVGAQIVNITANNFASVTGGVVSSGVMSAAVRANAERGLTPSGLPKVRGAEDGAKQTAVDSAIATLTAATLPLVPPTPPPPTIQLPVVQNFLLPGGGQVPLTAAQSSPPQASPPQASPPQAPPPPTPPPPTLQPPKRPPDDDRETDRIPRCSTRVASPGTTPQNFFSRTNPYVLVRGSANGKR